MSATIKDVARLARVSTASVSRALNDSGPIAPKTRARVLSVARRLRYSPHAVARSLSMRRTQTIGVVLPDIYGEYFSELIRGMDRAARMSGLHLLVSSSHGDAAEAAAALRAMNGRVDGLLILSPQVDAGFLNETLPAEMPVVLLNSRDASGLRSNITVDNFGGARQVTAHLARLHAGRMAHIGGPRDNHESRERLRGFRAALRDFGRGADEILLDGDFTEEAGCRAGTRIAGMKKRPTAIFAGNDMMAIGCLYALTEAGLRVPQDIALAGFDDIPIARYVTPPLTTVRTAIADLGRLACERLTALLGDDRRQDSTAVETLESRLIVRASCGARTGR